ncbi:DUF4283 domain-containing protein [Cephalotus follicularis]|uniref:DUF4283 domain-containing protein n=1 Tax=Cephalotus follicularis TaxID=3775 RepID=A0A1Q3C702_CEPFO|nr:DUF4283 domain-containing protein [Cephalotus follicularis]
MPLLGPPPLVGAPPSATAPQPTGASHLLPPPPIKSYASILGPSKANPFCSLASLPNIPPIPLSPLSTSSTDGLTLISFSPADFQAAAAYHNLTLLARFPSRAPSVNVFDTHVNTSWGLSKPATVGPLDHRLISIQLQDQADLAIAWSRVSRVFNGQSFLLLRWSSDSKRRDSPLAAIWMRLPGLPLPLHNPSFLKAIGDSLGRYLCSDAYTAKLKNPRAARICVELDISKPLPSAFIAAFGVMQFHQRILIESRTSYCTHCLLQGHIASSCRNRKGKRPIVATIPSAPSGKDCCGGLLPAGTNSHGLPNLPPSLPFEALLRRPPGACGNDSMASLHSQQAPIRADAVLDPPLTPLVVSAQAHSPPIPLVGPALIPPALSPPAPPFSP